MAGTIWYLPFEEQFIVWLQHLGEGTFLQTLLFYLNNFFSFLGEEVICIAVMGFVYWGLDKKKGENIGAAIMLVNVGTGLLKNIFSRLRPWASCDSIELLRDVDGFSFPSGHSANCAALYPTTAYEYRDRKWLKYIAVFVPVLCAVSRNYVGAHWLTDVVVGLATGLLIFCFTEFVIARSKNKYIFYFAAIIISSVGLFYCKTNDYFNSYGMLIGFTFGLMYEEKHTKFENTSSPWIALLRTAVGGGLYFGLSSAIKLVIGNIFPTGSFGYLLMRTVRYGIVVFLLIAIYPYAFRLEEKIFRKKEKSEE